MIKEEVEIVKKTNRVRLCDICEQEISNGDRAYNQYPSERCCVCKKDLCQWHRNEDPNADSWDKENGTAKVYCDDCFRVAEKYLYELKQLEEDYRQNKQMVIWRMVEECKKMKKETESNE
jgi:hypothetical protein